MEISKKIVVFDAAEIAPESHFWAGLLGGTVQEDSDGDWHTVLVDGQEVIGVQLAPDHVAPQWPDGDVPQQIHIDLYIEDLAAAHEEATTLGARVLQTAEDPAAGSGFQVYADPAGHPFCLCWG